MIEVRSVSKSYGAVKAVKELSFTAREGEIFGLLGPNGAGKSTIIKMMLNILLPDSGSILFNDSPIRESDKDRIGYLPEERGFYRNVRINDMLLYLADLKNADRYESTRRLDEWLERFGLTRWKTCTPEALSKGMAQKVQFIASILHDPELLFLDEPFSGLDPLSSDMLRDAIVDLGSIGKTILFSTHDMAVAERICSRILVIDHGREVISGTVAEIKSRFRPNRVTVEFDGSIDFEALHPLVRSVSRFPRWVEMELVEGTDPQAILRALIDQVSIRRFEVDSPSLHRIFVELVGNNGNNGAEAKSVIHE